MLPILLLQAETPLLDAAALPSAHLVHGYRGLKHHYIARAVTLLSKYFLVMKTIKINNEIK